jgi:hypothetical protein
VEHHRFAVAAQLDVELDSESLLYGRGDRGSAILDQGAAMEAAMGEGDGAEPLELSPP